jgi:hypothetical protein
LAKRRRPEIGGYREAGGACLGFYRQTLVWGDESFERPVAVTRRLWTRPGHFMRLRRFGPLFNRLFFRRASASKGSVTGRIGFADVGPRHTSCHPQIPKSPIHSRSLA